MKILRAILAKVVFYPYLTELFTDIRFAIEYHKLEMRHAEDRSVFPYCAFHVKIGHFRQRYNVAESGQFLQCGSMGEFFHLSSNPVEI